MIDTLQFNDFIAKNKLFTVNDKILLTVSGGMDSVLMFHLFLQSDYKFGVAHVNFHLRGKDSDGDQKFVDNLALENKIPFYTIDFDTQKYAESKGISIEMAARELRYNWFEEIRKKYAYSYIATAHHANDSVETFHLNSMRATGLRGLTGIKRKNGFIVRPLLFYTRAEINEIIKREKLPFRNDYTNQQTDIARNKIRNDIIPVFEMIRPEYVKQLLKTMVYLEQSQDFINEQIEGIRQEAISFNNEAIEMNFEKYKKSHSLNFLLYEFLYPYGFNSEQISMILKSLHGNEYAKFVSSDYELFAAKYLVFLRNHSNEHLKEFAILTFKDLRHFFHVIENPEINALTVKKMPLTDLLIEKEVLKFPLFIRKWKAGDVFKPLGMKGKKKVSDFLTDLKLNPIEKEKVKVLLNKDGEIIWLIAYRSSSDYMVKNFDNELVLLRYKK